MLYLLSQLFKDKSISHLLQSHIVLMGIGLLLSFLLTFIFLPRLWKLLPTDQGKQIAFNSMASKGKPTGAGSIMMLITIPVITLVFPFTIQSWYIWGLLGTLFFAMLAGFLDDRSSVPWGENKKLLVDILISFVAAWIFCCRPTENPITGEWQYFLTPQSTPIWFPFIKQCGPYIPEQWHHFIAYGGMDTLILHPIFYLIGATGVLVFSINATNCSDGVDNLAGMLSLVSLIVLAFFLYTVVGHTEYANYLLIPHHAGAPRWAIVLLCFVGSLCGYIWYNAYPSMVMMGDAGSRALGLLIGISVLFSGNPFMIIAVAPMILANGGSGLVKLLCLRLFKFLGADITPPKKLYELKEQNPNFIPPNQHSVIKLLHHFRFPLHDHFKQEKKWSPAQVMIRFLIIQSLITPFLIILLVKLR